MATIRQERAMNKLSESAGKLSMTKTLIAAGYSPKSARNPQRVTRSKGWEELKAKYVPDELLAKVHHNLLKNKNWKAQDSGLDKGYKVKGYYAPEKALDEVARAKIDQLSDELKELIGAP